MAMGITVFLRNAWCWSAHCAATSASPSCRRSRRRAPLRLPWRPEPVATALSVGRCSDHQPKCWFFAVFAGFHGDFMVFSWFFAGFLLEIEALKVVISMGFHWEFQQHGDLLEILFASNMLIFCGMNGMSPYLTGNGGKPTENLWKHMVEKWDIPDTVNPTKMRIICHKSWVCGQKCRFECQEGWTVEPPRMAYGDIFIGIWCYHFWWEWIYFEGYMNIYIYIN